MLLLSQLHPSEKRFQKPSVRAASASRYSELFDIVRLKLNILCMLIVVLPQGRREQVAGESKKSRREAEFLSDRGG